MKKILVCILCTTLIVSLTFGVGSATTTSSAKKIIVTLMQNKVEIQPQMQKVAAAFNKSQKEVEVKILGISGTDYLGNLQAQFASSPKKACTIFTSAAGPEQARFLKFMAPLDKAKAKSNIATGLATDATVGGKLYGLPVSVEGFGLVYNKAMFKEAGINPSSLKTMDAFIAACTKLEKINGVEHAVGFAKESYFSFMHPFNWGFGVMKDYKAQIDKVSKKQVALKDVKGVKQFALDFDRLKPFTNSAKDKYDDQIAGFATGKYAMIHQGNWAVGLLKDYNVDFQYGMIPFPTSGNTSISVGVSGYYRVNKYATADQQKGAVKFLDWLITSKQGQDFYINQLKFIPAYKGMSSATLDPLAKEVSSYTVKGKTIPWTYSYFPSGIDVDSATQVEKYYAGQLDINQLLKELNDIWVKAVK